MVLRVDSGVRRRWVRWGAVALAACWAGAAAPGMAREPEETGETDVPAATSWLDSAVGVRLGLLDFDVAGARPEWNLGLGGTSEGRRLRWSFLGGGLALSRGPDDDLDLPDRGLLDGVGVGAWLGGCMVCTFSRTTRLNFEARWAPDAAYLLDPGDRSDSRVGVTLELNW